jgi:hypothetical protein
MTENNTPPPSPLGELALMLHPKKTPLKAVRGFFWVDVRCCCRICEAFIRRDEVIITSN